MAEIKNLLQPFNTASGLAEYVLLAPLAWFASVKAPSTTPVDPGDEVIIKESHVFKPNKGFLKFVLSPEKNQLSGSNIGELGHQKMDQQLEIFVPGSYVEQHEVIKNLKNIPLIALHKDANCPLNMWYQLGDGCNFAYAKFDFSTGTVREGVKGYKGVVTYVKSFVQLYEGLITIYDPEADNLAPLFLAATNVMQITGGVSALRNMYNNAQSVTIAEIYNLLLEQADAWIISIGFATDQGDKFNEYLIQADLSTLQNFTESLYEWIYLNGTSQSLELIGGKLFIQDDDALEAYIGIAVPQNILGDDETILLVDDEPTVLKTQ